jgi:hypothetical protein
VIFAVFSILLKNTNKSTEKTPGDLPGYRFNRRVFANPQKPTFSKNIQKR